MPIILIIAIVTVLIALILYSIGVWNQKIVGRLKAWHVSIFWTGLFFDALSTICMGLVAGKMDLDLHGLSGIIAFILMLANAIWATLVIRSKNEKAIHNFHKFSIFVWIIWLIPFFSGAFNAMSH